MTRTEHTLSNGQQICFHVLTGVVLEANKSSVTQVHQTEHRLNGTSRVIPGQIYSTTDTTQEIWLRSDDGREHSVNLGSLEIPVRTGHLLSVVSSGALDGPLSAPYGARNHTTSQIVCTPSSDGWKFAGMEFDSGQRGIFRRWLTLGPVVGAVLIGLAYRLNPIAIVAGAVAGLVAGWLGLFIRIPLGPMQQHQALVDEARRAAERAMASAAPPGLERPAA